jgi:hypothetical protein
MRYPTKPEVVRFVHYAHSVEKLKVERQDIDDIYAGKGKNPFVIGMFDALNYGLRSLLCSPDFPCKDPSTLYNLYRSYDALHWLRELHTKMLLPVASASEKDESWPSEYRITRAAVGTYRTTEEALAFCMAPPARLIPALLHNWLVSLSQFHEKVKDNVDNPYGISQDDAHRMSIIASDACLFFACTHPFPWANNRVGRLVENLLRLTWRLPWQEVPGYGNNADREYVEWVHKLTRYQETKLPELIEAAEATFKQFGQ